MANRTFVDSNYFISLYNTGDSNHKKADAFSSKIIKSGISEVISNYVFSEIVTVTSQKVSKTAGLLIGNRLRGQKRLTIIHIDQKLHDATWEIFKKVNSKNISFVDCSILAVMKENDIRHLVTFDDHFSAFKKLYRFKINAF